MSGKEIRMHRRAWAEWAGWDWRFHGQRQMTLRLALQLSRCKNNCARRLLLGLGEKEAS